MLSKVLIALYKNDVLGRELIFKWGTCAMLFYGLPRLSVDLDFDLKSEYTLEMWRILQKNLSMILLGFWEITDMAEKYNTILYEVRYKDYEKRLKIEISKRRNKVKTLQKNFLWENIILVSKDTLFSQKLIALLHRKWITNRDIFDIWFFLSQGTDIDASIIEDFTESPIGAYLERVYNFIEAYDFQKALYWLGELLDTTQKNFVKHKMQNEILGYLNFYR